MFRPELYLLLILLADVLELETHESADSRQGDALACGWAGCESPVDKADVLPDYLPRLVQYLIFIQGLSSSPWPSLRLREGCVNCFGIILFRS